MEDRKKIRYNLVMGMTSQIITLILGIVIPKLVLSSYGSEINGLLSSVTNIYAYIALVEAGISAASCQALYEPLASNNRQRVNAVLSASHQYFRRSGLIYCALIVLFSTAYPLLIQTEIPYITIVLVILLNGIGNVINYFFHGKYLVLLKADGKRFVEIGLGTVTYVLKQLSKIILIALGFDVVVVQLMAMLMSFVQMICITIYIKKHYSWIDLHATPDKQAISQSKNVLVHEINYLITANVDVVLLTAFSNLKNVSVYSLYHLLFSMINKLLRIVRDSFEFKIARLYHGDKDSFVRVFGMFESCYISVAFAMFSILNFFILPFLKIYTEGITDIEYINALFPALFVAINLLSAGRYPSDALIHIAGHFKLTQGSAVTESVINLFVSFLLVQRYGIAGVLLGTIVSSLYRTNYLILYVNRHILNRNPLSTYLCWGVNFIVYLVILEINNHLVVRADSYLQIIGACIPYSAAVLVIYCCAALICNPGILRLLKEMIAHYRSKKI